MGEKVKALAGIGFPQRFFDDLNSAGLDVECTAFSDHHPFSRHDIEPFLDSTLLITHKDAVKTQEMG